MCLCVCLADIRSVSNCAHTQVLQVCSPHTAHIAVLLDSRVYVCVCVVVYVCRCRCTSLRHAHTFGHASRACCVGFKVRYRPFLNAATGETGEMGEGIDRFRHAHKIPYWTREALLLNTTTRYVSLCLHTPAAHQRHAHSRCAYLYATVHAQGPVCCAAMTALWLC